MYIGLAIFWIVVGVILQVFWDTLKERAWIPIDRGLMAIICFIMFSYCIFRWRMARALAAAQEGSKEPPVPRPRRAYDATLDFSPTPKPPKGDEKKPKS